MFLEISQNSQENTCARVPYSSFFVIFNCNVFWNMKRHFVKLMNRLLQRMIHQVMWYFWVFIVNPFSFLWSISFFQENCASFGLLVSCLSLSPSALILLVSLVWGFSWKLLLPLEKYCQSHLMNLIQLIDCWRADDKFSWNNFYFIVAKVFWYGKKY